jgi:uncharacterized coiled-coil protein SlyX
MASFPNRRAELANRLAETAVEPIERVRIGAVFDDVFAIRDAALTMVQTYVADDGKDELGKDYTDALSNFRSRMDAKWSDMLSGLSTPSDAAVKFRERILVEEAGFWGAPGLVNLVAARDDMVRRARTFRETSEALDKKWAAYTEEDRRVEQAEADAARQVQDIINKAIAEQAGTMRQLGNSLSELLQKLSRIDDLVNEWAVAFMVGIGVPRNIAEFIAKLSQIGQGAFDKAKELGIPAAALAAAIGAISPVDPGFAAVEFLKGLMGSQMRDLFTAYSAMKKGLQYGLQEPYVEKVAFYRGLLAPHSAIIVTFGGTRSETDRFLQQNNTTIARANLDKALEDLDRWRDGAMTDGQRADAGLVRNAARDALLGRLAGLAREWEAMFRRHEGRFMGPLSSETEKEFLNTDVWIVTVNGMVQLGLDEKLRDWRRQMLEVPARIGESFNRVERAFGNLPLEIRDKLRSRIDSYLDQELRTLNSEAEETARALDQCALAVNARKVEQDFSRAALREKLRN